MNPQPSDPWREPGPDPGVLNAAQRGELVALFSMLRAHRMELWRVCLALTLDHRRAERLFHETLVRAAKNLRTVPPGSPILHWLTRLATHLAVAWTRQEGPRRPGEPTGDWPGGGAESSNPAPGTGYLPQPALGSPLSARFAGEIETGPAGPLPSRQEL